MRHSEVTQDLKDEACRLFKNGMSHADTLVQLGIDPDPDNKLIWGWLIEQAALKDVVVKMKLIVTCRGHDYHACIEGRNEIWAAGKTICEAIGDLMIHHEDSTGIEIVLP